MSNLIDGDFILIQATLCKFDSYPNFDSDPTVKIISRLSKVEGNKQRNKLALILSFLYLLILNSFLWRIIKLNVIFLQFFSS